MDENKKIAKAMEIIERYGGIDGDHHKQWVIDQVARALMDDEYSVWVVDMCAGEDGPCTYQWETGVAP